MKTTTTTNKQNNEFQINVDYFRKFRHCNTGFDNRTVKRARNYIPPQDITCIIYHYPCTDGYCAAFISQLYQEYKMVNMPYQRYQKIKFIPFTYGEKIDEMELIGETILLVDCSVDKKTLKRWRSNLSYRIMILDHHYSAYQQLKNVRGCFFDLNHSGCCLAWQYFFPTHSIPDLILYIEDQDLWRWQLKDSKPFNLALKNLMKRQFDHFEQCLYPNTVQYLIEQGKQMNNSLEEYIQNKSKDAKYIKFDKFNNVALIECTKHTSELGAHLAKSSDFALLYFYKPKEQQIICSLRSVNTDVSKIAKKYGGGGHRLASGFIIKGTDINDLFVVNNNNNKITIN